MTVRSKRIIAYVIGYSSIFVVALLYNHLERTQGGVIAVLTSLIILVPIGIVWRKYYNKLRGAL